ncbi:MAG: 50S ribosomal protein L21 [Proteobacteria bacterium]|nr:50S ribosomal protein L21 [Pseudomonadota bacterium]MCH9758618.1 50S ribosomal protein L21 [Pseudomonadota bacterium]
MSNTHVTIATSGGQYRVKSGDIITVNRLTAEIGSEIVLDNVLLVEKEDGNVLTATANGSVSGAQVTALVKDHPRGKKLRVYKMRRRKKSRRTQGHRQDLTQLVVGEIKLSA